VIEAKSMELIGAYREVNCRRWQCWRFVSFKPPGDAGRIERCHACFDPGVRARPVVTCERGHGRCVHLLRGVGGRCLRSSTSSQTTTAGHASSRTTAIAVHVEITNRKRIVATASTPTAPHIQISPAERPWRETALAATYDWLW